MNPLLAGLETTDEPLEIVGRDVLKSRSPYDVGLGIALNGFAVVGECPRSHTAACDVIEPPREPLTEGQGLSIRKRGVVGLGDHLGEDEGRDAGARIAAMRAGQDSKVREFRADILGSPDRVLELSTPAEIEAWLEEKATQEGEGESSEYVGGVVRRKKVEVLTYDYPHGTAVLTTPDTPLWRLKKTADHLGSRYGWKEDAAVRFILTGEAPGVRNAAWKVQVHNFARSNRIVLECDPQMSHREITDLFDLARNAYPEALRWASRLVNARNCELAVFVAEQNDGCRWSDVQDAWEEGHPGDERCLENFVRDARTAYRAVTGSKLEWKRKRGERGNAKSISSSDA